jgi:hypothetical protein
MFFSKDGCKIFNQMECKVIGRQVATAKEVKGVYELELIVLSMINKNAW